MRISTTTAGMILASFAGVASANHVDFMTDGFFSLLGPGSTVVPGDSANILGGARFVGLSASDGLSTASMLDGDNFITYDNDATGNGVLTLDYGDFAGGNGPLNSDFGSDWNFVAVQMLGVVGEGTMSLTFESDAGAGTSAGVTVDSMGIYFFSFDDAAYDAVDFSDIDRVTLTLAGQSSSEFLIQGITREVTPAPASAALLGLGGLCAARRRRG